MSTWMQIVNTMEIYIYIFYLTKKQVKYLLGAKIYFPNTPVIFAFHPIPLKDDEPIYRFLLMFEMIYEPYENPSFILLNCDT